ncbi:MAG: glycine/betaine ABC transporter [Bacillota bacterium]|nr:glycine/betaine ABC transporter [Bacillota bacterium]REJ37617.1 MAG: glycine/betaine ABC transporter [Bacillota bacterium]
MPLGQWIDGALEWLFPRFAPVTGAIKAGVTWLLANLEMGLNAVPPLLLVAAVTLVAWRVAGRGVAAVSLLGLLLIDGMGYWTEAMTTLSIVSTGVLISLSLGIPLGILAARSDRFLAVLRPILDLMQTMPSFVYLIPAIFLFSIGRVPAVIATVIYSMPPAIRLTNLGIRQVRSDIIEAGRAFGCTPWQLLTRIQLPLALPSIMAGINQTIMMALSMSVVAAMIGARGLGSIVIQALNTVQIGKGFEGGLAIVIMAVILDRITQALGGRQAASTLGRGE